MSSIAKVVILLYGDYSQSEENSLKIEGNEHLQHNYTFPLNTLPLEGVAQIRLFKANDQKTPNMLLMCEMYSQEDIASNTDTAVEYITSKLKDAAPFRVDRVDVYSQISSFGGNPKEARYMVVVALEPVEGTEDNFNSWYEQEHMSMLSAVPGWIRGRRFILYNFTAFEVDGSIAASGSGIQLPGGARPIKYLAIHEYKNQDYRGSLEWEKATNTPWRTEVMSQVEGRERREWVLEKALYGEEARD